MNNTVITDHLCKPNHMCICEHVKCLEQKWTIKIFNRKNVLKLQPHPLQTDFGIKDLINYYNSQSNTFFIGLTKDHLLDLMIDFVDLIEQFNTWLKPTVKGAK